MSTVSEAHSGNRQIAALFVETDGVYFGLDGVDPWDEARDARLYDGPWPVVAHPPCQRWGQYWWGGPGTTKRFKLGDDGGCFGYALNCVREFGGVLEHPRGSHAWSHFGLTKPPPTGWVSAGDFIGWTCCVEQGHYGHRARKPTWLYACGVKELPSLKWGPSEYEIDCQHMGRRERAHTPPEFRDLLISIAKSCHQGT